MPDAKAQVAPLLRAQPPAGRPFTGPEALMVGAIAVAALYFGREVFVPLALATLLGFVLAPLVRLLRRCRLGRVLSVLVAVACAFVVIGGLGAIIGSQVAHLADNLPQYQSTIGQKLHALRGTTAQSGVVERASSLLKDLGDQVKEAPGSDQASGAPPRPGAARPRAGAENQKPIPVEIQEPPPTPLQLVQSFIAPLLGPLATTGIVVVFLIFILLQREDLRDRFIRLAGSHDLQRTTRALDDAAERVSRYFLMQSAINACFGVIIGAGLWLIGLPNPALWGILGALFRFIPYIGAPIAAIFPAAIAIAVDPGWSMLLWTVALFLVTEPVTGQVVEPLLYGHSTGLSAIAVVVSAAFWTLLWGPIGLLLSTPLTVCLVVLGRHVERLQFLDVMLGDRPALAAEESFYQRILAGDAEEVAEQAEIFLRTNSLSAYYDEVALRGLRLAQLDASRGALDEDRRRRIKETIEEVIEDLADHDDVAPTGSNAETSAVAPPPRLAAEETAPAWRGDPLLCVAGRGVLDEAAALLLTQLLEKHGIGARLLPSEAMSASNLSRLELTGTRMVCLSYLDANSLTHARFFTRRLRRKLPGVPILAGLWTLPAAEKGARDDIVRDVGADFLATSFHEAVEQAVQAALRHPSVPDVADAADVHALVPAAPEGRVPGLRKPGGVGNVIEAEGGAQA